MGNDFPPVYPNSHGEAMRCGDELEYDRSFRQNVCCARDIEQAIRDYSNEADWNLNENCAQTVLEKYGFSRVNFVLANSLQEAGCKYLFSDEVLAWGQKTYVPPDGQYNRYFAVDTACRSLEEFVNQARQAYQDLGLFGPEHCLEDSRDLDYEGKVLVIDPNRLKESCWTPQDCLWYAEGGFGCSPTARGRGVLAKCLGDGEETYWNRADFIGVLDEKFLPDWAQEPLAELRGPEQTQDVGPIMGGMK